MTYDPYHRQLGFGQNELGQDCVFQRTRVDYYNEPWESPHFLANPLSKYKEMSLGGVDFYQMGLRKLENGTLFQDMTNNYVSNPNNYPAFEDDSHNRFELINDGNIPEFRRLYRSPFSREVVHVTK
jgi:hypothetical protein